MNQNFSTTVVGIMVSTMTAALAAFGSQVALAQEAKAATAAREPITALQCARLVDVKTLSMLTARTIIVEGKRIARIESGYTAPAGATVIALKEHTCMPGLMDMHVHLASSVTRNSNIESMSFNPPDYTVRAVANAEKTLMAGFTSVRELGAPQGVSVALREGINQGIIKGPRLQVSGGVSSTGGHGDPANGLRSDLAATPGLARGIADSPDEAARVVRMRYRERFDFIKIATTGGVLSLARSGDAPLLSDEELKTIVQTAKDYNMPVAAHAHGAEGMKRAIRAGVQTIEHGTYMDDEAMKLMKERGTWLVPTISAGKFVAERAKEQGFFQEIVRVKAATIGPEIQGMFARAYKAGVKIAFGTDQGVGPHGDNAKEFQYMVEAGMPPLEAIRSATLHGAMVMGSEKDLGTIEPGKLADVVAVTGDPVKDITTMMKMAMVMKDGVVYKKP
jgi:imidazolonepropionase-like amidohydrolase